MPDTSTRAATRDRLIARRIAGGGDRATSERLLDEHVRTLGESALAYALHYDGFATARTADDDAADLLRCSRCDAPTEPIGHAARTCSTLRCTGNVRPAHAEAARRREATS